MTRLLLKLHVFLLLVTPIGLPGSPSNASERSDQRLKVFILAGQSNMQGQGVVDLDHPQYYNGGKGTLVWSMEHSPSKDRMQHLKDADGKWLVRSDVFVHYQTERELKTGGLTIGFTGYEGKHHLGPELQFGQVLGDHFDEPVLLIKTCWGGKSLFRDFRPPSAGGESGEYFREMLKEIRDALAALPTEFPQLAAHRYELAGFVWMQGWNDMISPQARAEYADNLVHLAHDMRKELNAPELPIVVGELGNGGVAKPDSHMQQFRVAQQEGTSRIKNARFVATHAFARPAEMSPNVGHGHHWFGNAESYFLIGDALGNAMVELIGETHQTTDWPQWRGPAANGVADDRHLATDWSTTQNVLWRVDLPGWGTSSPVVFGDRVFVTSEAEQQGRKSLLTLCYRRRDGEELWRDDFGLGADQRTHEKSNLAANTPAVTADAVYVSFANADSACYSHDGKLQWVTRYISRFGDPKMAWGYCPSPVVLDDSVLLPWDHHSGPCYLIGLDKRTGEIAWKKERPIGTAHATPLLVEHHGRTDILVPGKHRLTAFDAKTHKQLWEYGAGSGPYNGEIIVSPVYGDGLVFTQLWRQSRIHAIRLNADGQQPTRLWVSDKPGGVEPSLLYYRGLLYAWMDNGVLVCLDGQSGSEHYRQRLGGNCNSSPIACDGRIYISNNDGTTFVVQAGSKFQLLARNDLGERITASPAISGDWLILRTDSQLFCIGKR